MYWTVTMTDGRTETRDGSEDDATRWAAEPGVANVILAETGRARIGTEPGAPTAGDASDDHGQGKDKGKHKGHDEP